MSASKTASWWQYSRWIYIIGRTMRFNYATVSERSAIETFLTAVVAGRPWLAPKLMINSTTGKSYDFASESDYNIAKMLTVVGRDLKKIPVTDAEKTAADTLIAATGNRRYGVKGNLI